MADQTGIAAHPLRNTLLNEAHARPFESLNAPLRVSHLVMHTGTSGRREEVEQMSGLCERLQGDPPTAEAGHFVLETSAFRLRWERHTEFSTYTIFVNGAESEPFSETAIQALPSTWLPGLPGELLAAMHVSLVPAASIEASIESLGR